MSMSSKLRFAGSHTQVFIDGMKNTFEKYQSPEKNTHCSKKINK